MSEVLERRAESIKLARLLGADQGSLDYLDGIPASDLRAFREQATERLFGASESALKRVGAAAGLLPSGLVAKIAERSFGPLLCARAAASVDSDKAIDVAGRLPATFLADVTVELDPRRVAEIIGRVPEELVVPVAEELGRRREHVTMGRFLAFVPDHAVAAAIGTLSDEALLRTAFVLEHKDRLDHALGLLPPERLPGLLRGATELGLWPETLDLLDHLSDARRGPIADAVAEQDEQVMADLVRAVDEAGIWESLLPVVRTMSEPSLLRLAGMEPLREQGALDQIVAAAAEAGLWADLVPLLDALSPDVRGRAAAAAARLDPDQIDRVLADAAGRPETFTALIALSAEMREHDRVIVEAVDRADREVAEQLVASLEQVERIDELLATLPPEVMEAIRRAASRLGMEGELEQILERAS